MSYILDALKKAEQKRQLSAKVPTLATVHGKPAPSRAATPFKLWPWIAGAVIVANAGIASWLLLPTETSSTASLDGSARPPSAPTAGAPKATGAAPPAADRGSLVSAPAPSEPPAAVAPPAPPPPVTAPAVAATAAPGKGQSSTATRPAPPATPARSDRQAPAPAPIAKAPAAPTAPALLPPAAARPGATAVSPRPSPAPTSPAEKAGPSPDRPAVAAIPPAVQARPADRAAPQSASPQETPQAVQGMLAKLKLQMVVYSEVPAERLVFINNQKYVEGSMIDGVLRLESIDHDGAVLTFQGQRFVLRQ